jgi:hypothetical protein
LKHSITRPKVPEPRCLMVMYVLFTIVVPPALHSVRRSVVVVPWPSSEFLCG